MDAAWYPAHHSKRARAALAHMPGIDPAIAALSLWCAHRDAEGRTKTAGDTIYYGLDFECLPLSEQTGLLAHHVLHVALRHAARAAAMAQRDGTTFRPGLYNLATDAIVNEALHMGGHALPRPAVLLSELFGALTSPPKAQEQALSNWDADRLYRYLTETREGTSRRGEARDYAEKQRFTEDLDAQSDTAPEPEVWAGRLKEALATGRSAGGGIGAALARFGDLPGTQTPWEIILRRLVTRALTAHPRLSHRRPANRWIAREAEALAVKAPSPVFEPGSLRDAKRPCLVIGLDTSSSISDRELDLFTAETRGIQRRTGAETHLLAFDTDVHLQMRLEPYTRFPDVAFRRGGGTAFGEVIETARDLRASALVVLTDLDGPTGPAPPFPVIWAVPGAERVPATFGSVLNLSA
ncbi:MAG: VWA-like domain-containing protein [Pseudomonadota bacterium]